MRYYHVVTRLLWWKVLLICGVSCLKCARATETSVGIVNEMATTLLEHADAPALPNTENTLLEEVHHSQTQAESRICAICLEPLEGEETTYACSNGHRFHASCIQQWRKEKSNCPICRSALTNLGVLQEKCHNEILNGIYFRSVTKVRYSVENYERKTVPR